MNNHRRRNRYFDFTCALAAYMHSSLMRDPSRSPLNPFLVVRVFSRRTSSSLNLLLGSLVPWDLGAPAGRAPVATTGPADSPGPAPAAPFCMMVWCSAVSGAWCGGST